MGNALLEMSNIDCFKVHAHFAFMAPEKSGENGLIIYTNKILLLQLFCLFVMFTCSPEISL